MLAARSSPVWICVLAAFLSLALAGCFEIEQRRQPPGQGGTIAGTIHVADASGLARRDGDAVRQVRVDVALAETRREVAPARDVVTPVRRAPSTERGDDRSKLPLEWKPGDVLVSFVDGAYDELSLEPVLRDMLDRSELDDVTPEVARCTALRWCTVRLRDARGELLDASRTADAAERLHKNRPALVKVVARNLKKYGFRVPNDEFFGFQWQYDFIHATAAWDIETGDPNLVIAVVDSGVVQAHPDLNDRLARDPQDNTIVGVDLVSTNDGDEFLGRDTNPEDPGDGALGGGQSTFHGTHIAGIIGAETDNREGVSGITFAGQILPVRVLGLGLSGFDDDIMDGIYWAIGEPNVTGVPNNVKPASVVNLSLGGPSDPASQTFWEEQFAAIFTDAQNRYNDPVFIAAAGNTDEDAGGIVPANLPNMITVGAATISGVRADYSNFGTVVDIMAPGGDGQTDLNSDGQPDGILSLVGTSYDLRDGTSMAAPHVTGVVALLRSAKPTLTPTQLETILKSSADGRGRCSAGCGAGWLDALTALLLAGGEVRPEPFLTADVTQVFLAQGQQSASLRIANIGNAPVSYSATIEGAQAGLFSVSPTSGTLTEGFTDPVQSVATLTVTVARGAFTAGSANLRITTSGTESPQTLSVSLAFDDDPNRLPRLLNTIEVAAYDINDDGTPGRKLAATTTSRDAGFVYELTGVPAGKVLVFAVGDDNLDGEFSANVESFGGWPTADAPEPVDVKEEDLVGGIDISIDSAFITDVVGGVGSPCNDANDCTFAADADCVTSFEGGYCSRICDDGECGTNGSCESMKCDGNADCNVCLVRCSNDTQCRFDEDYVCDLGACVPRFLQLDP